ncbi:MAG: hypothetical protein AAFX85_00940, partial [Pseudomonadota bacterium]
MNRYGIAASAGIASLVLATSAALAEPTISFDTKHAHTGAMKIQDLQKLAGPRRAGAGLSTVKTRALAPAPVRGAAHGPLEGQVVPAHADG